MANIYQKLSNNLQAYVKKVLSFIRCTTTLSKIDDRLQTDGKTCYHNQRILKNLDVHKLMIEILRLPFSKSLFTCAFSFLAAVRI